MKRYFSLFLLLIFLIPCLIVPASATGAYDDVISENVETIAGDLYSWFEQWYAYFLEATETVNDVSGAEVLITPFKRDLIEVQMFFWSWISDTFADIESHLKKISQLIDTGVANTIGECANVIRYYSYLIYMEFTDHLVNMMNDLDGLYNYFFVEDTRAYYYELVYEWGEGLQGNLLAGTFTSFKADLYDVLQTITGAVFELIVGKSSLPDDIQAEVDADATEASEYLDILDDVTKPDESEIEDLADISGYVNAGDVSVLAACLSPLFTSAVFLPCIMLSLIFMLVAYVLYGKR